MKFKIKEDELIAMDVVRDKKAALFTLSEKGYGKMSSLEEYAVQGRGGTGVFTFRVKEKTGNLVIARIVDKPEETEIVVISGKGQVIRSSMKDIPVLSRQTSGVKVMSLYEEDYVAALAIL
jgi:DNA gyrase subunit A